MKKAKLFQFTVCLFINIFILFFTANSGVKAFANWERVTSSNKDFSFEIPTGYDLYQINEERYLDTGMTIKISEIREYSVFLNGCVVIVQMLKTNNVKKVYENYKRDEEITSFNPHKKTISQNKTEKPYGYEFEYIEDNSFRKRIYVRGKEHVYYITVAARNQNNPEMERFLFSMQIVTKEVSQTNSTTQNLNKQGLDSSNLEKKADDDRVYKPSDVAKKGVIIWNPQPEYTMAAREKMTQGILRVEVVLSSDGKVTNIEALNDLPNGLTEMAIEAAKRIKFLPSEKDGRLVSQYVKLEYNFRIY